MNRPIVIAGGGTGGHVFVAQAVATALLDSGASRHDLAFVGSSRGQERTLLADSGISLTLLPGRGIQRSLAPKAILRNIRAVLGLAYGVASMSVRFAKWKPRCVVSVGGYAALPAGLGAALWRRPLVLVNIDAAPGSTHRFLARFASASCVIAASTQLPNPTVTGAPVRREFVGLDRSPAARSLAKSKLGCDPDRPFIAVVTGSLGARSVNQAVLSLASLWRDRAITVFHVTGNRDVNEISRDRPTGKLTLDYRVVAFQNDMALLYQAADVLICRSGALTVAELGVIGLVAVLVPLPGAPRDHQTMNAKVIVDAGAGLFVADPDLNAAKLGDLLNGLLDDPDHLAEMESHAKALGHEDAARRVAEVIESYG